MYVIQPVLAFDMNVRIKTHRRSTCVTQIRGTYIICTCTRYILGETLEEAISRYIKYMIFNSHFQIINNLNGNR